MRQQIGSYAEQVVAEAILRTEYRELRSLSTGIPSLDAHLGSVIDRGRVLVIAAQTGVGKTVLAGQLACSFAAQTPVLWCTLEDDPVDAARRPLAALSGLDIGQLRGGFADEVPAVLRGAADKLADLPIEVVDSASDVVDIGIEAAEWAAAHGIDATSLPGVLIVDQLSHIKNTRHLTATQRSLWEKRGLPVLPRPGASEADHYEWVVETLVCIAKRHNLFVVLFHQLNDSRDEHDGQPTLESIRSSRGIAMKASGIVILWRPKRLRNPHYDLAPRTEPKWVGNESGRTWLLGPKLRHAPNFEVEVAWHAESQRYGDVGVDDSTLELPDAPSERAREGQRKLADLRAKYERGRQRPTEFACVINSSAPAATITGSAQASKVEPETESTPDPDSVDGPGRPS